MFFKDIADFKNYLTINVSFNFKELSVYLKSVDTNILKKYLGETFYTQAQTAYNASITLQNPQPIIGEMAQVIELIRQCTPYFAIAKWIPVGQVMIDNSGIRITTSENVKPAFQWQVRELKDSLNETGTTSLENLLEYLEKTISAFPAYKSSDEYKSNKSLFVSSSKLFLENYSLMLGGRSNYYRLKSTIKKIEEFEVKAVILPDLYNYLKTKSKAGTAFNDSDNALMDLIIPAVVNLTIAKAVNEIPAKLNADGFLVFDNTTGESLDSKKSASHVDLSRIGLEADKDGRTYLKKLKEYLEANKTTYLLYANDSTYIETTTTTNTQADTDSFYSAL
jgi:hypothetical protein